MNKSEQLWRIQFCDSLDEFLVELNNKKREFDDRYTNFTIKKILLYDTFFYDVYGEPK